MFPSLIQSREAILNPENIQVSSNLCYGQRVGADPCLVLTSDPKPRLRWTTDLHERFVDAVTQLGGPGSYSEGYNAYYGCQGIDTVSLEKPSPDLHTSFQKYRLGKQSGKEFGEASKDGSYHLDSPRATDSPQNMQASDMNEGYEVKEALRAQMEVQSKLHLQVEAEKHLQIRQDAEERYIAMLERACKMLADQILGPAATNDDGEGCHGKGVNLAPINPLEPYPLHSADMFQAHIPAEVSPKFHPQHADCSTESCLTSHGSPVGMRIERSSSGGNRGMRNKDTTDASFIWGESDAYTPDLHIVQHVDSHGITGCGV
ncbi:hypothetical protein F511_34248 [Dorcoceras hygrometricum]|uniref:MYB-CC type transcription factor LHEQLE-containing domain-containing protein n=1 Tax=Dorcoceras hygrometricum TaxID=472368 RepID=A0A2Z7CDK4_9LAMI|nr:hypothetical protein F511_34248 [Dorcoceras hygrometricum]